MLALIVSAPPTQRDAEKAIEDAMRHGRNLQQSVLGVVATAVRRDSDRTAQGTQARIKGTWRLHCCTVHGVAPA